MAGSRMAPDEVHFVSITAGAGYQGLISSSDAIHPGMGVAPSLGVTYRYCRNRLIVQTGLEGEFSFLTNLMDSTHIAEPGRIDNEGDTYTLLASICDAKETIHSAQLCLPLLLGYEYRYFYFLTGAKIGLNVFGTTHMTVLLSDMGAYERYIDPFRDMPNHNYVEGVPERSDTYPLHFSPSVQVHLELGGRIDRIDNLEDRSVPRHHYRLYIAAFADYGLTNIHESKSYGNCITYAASEEYDNKVALSIVPPMVSQQTLNQRFYPLTVGVKLTCSFELPKKHKCVLCKD